MNEMCNQTRQKDIQTNRPVTSDDQRAISGSAFAHETRYIKLHQPAHVQFTPVNL